MCSWAPSAPAWVVSPSSSSLGKEQYTPPAHSPSQSPPGNREQETPTLPNQMAGVQCARPASLFTQPPAAALASPQPPEFSQGLQPPVSMFPDSPRPRGHRKLSQGFCHLASGLCLQLRAPGRGVSHQPPLHMDTHIAGRGSPGSPLLSCDPGKHPRVEGKEKSQSSLSLSISTNLLPSPWECLALAWTPGRGLVTKPSHFQQD